MEIHILGHMFLSRRRSRGETDGHKVCQKGFREAMLHSVIPWYKLASISPPPQHFCDTAATWLAGVRDQLLSPSLFKTLSMWPVIDLIFAQLSASMKNEAAAAAGSGFLACGGEQETGTKIGGTTRAGHIVPKLGQGLPWALPQLHVTPCLAGRLGGSGNGLCACRIFSWFLFNIEKAHRACDTCLVSVFLRIFKVRSQHSKMEQMNRAKLKQWFYSSLPMTD